MQPALTAGPASLVFWAFWTAHTIIAACAVYDIGVLGFRPGWHDLGRAFAVSVAYVALMVPLNAWLGSDYGFIGNPAAGTFKFRRSSMRWDLGRNARSSLSCWRRSASSSCSCRGRSLPGGRRYASRVSVDHGRITA